MKVMFTVLYLTVGINSISSARFSCLRDHPRVYSIDEMEKIVYEVATVKGVPPAVILNRIMRKVRYRQRTDKTKLKNPLQDLALQELLATKYRPPSPEPDDPRRPPPPVQSALPPSRAFVPPAHRPVPQSQRPLAPPVYPMHPTGLMTEVFFTKDTVNPQPYPNSFYIPIQNLEPPPGVTIRVEAGMREVVLPEVKVTLSPMMTTVEALRQAEGKYRTFLGQSDDDAVISFRQSSVTECYIVASFNDLQTDDRGYWKIVISDRTGKEIYQSVCLPTRNEVPIKPGMTITLLYTLT